VTEDEIIRFVAGLPGVYVDTASETTGAPEVAWGDSFFSYDPDDVAENRRFPFATIVTKNYGGFDEASDLDREGVFRLNVSAGRQRFEALVGYPPGEHDPRETQCDYSVLDTVLPHPVYAGQAWVSILNPGEQTDALARVLVTEAHEQAAARYRRRQPS